MYSSLLLPDLREMLKDNDTQALSEFCNALHPAVIAEVISELKSKAAWKVLSNCSSERTAEILRFLELPDQVELVGVIDRQPLSQLIEVMAPDDRVDLLSRMDPDRVENLLPLIAQAERSDIRKLLSYPEDSAGAIMTTEYASLPEDITVGEALDQLRLQAPDSETIYYIFITDEGRRLRGIVSLRDLILAKPGTLLSAIMFRDVISVRVDDDQELVVRELARFDFLAIPVIDNQYRLVGIVTHDDAVDILQEEATEDAHRQAAVEPLEDSYLSTNLPTIIWKRGFWLVPLLGAGFLTAWVLRQYEYISEAYEWFNWFLPLIIASGGNAGSQSATLIIRAMAIEEMDRHDIIKMIKRELVVAMMLALGLMTLGYLIATVFFSREQAEVVATTIFLVVLMGTTIGALIPLLFRKLGMDPALMSNPLLAAIVDVFGAVIYCTVVIILLMS